MKRITRDKARTYDLIAKEPLLKVTQGEKFVIETEDANNYRMTKPSELPTAEFVPEVLTREVNPVGGPVYVEGAKPGDLLAVDILDIIPDVQGVTALIPGCGPLHDSASWPECRGPLTHIIKHLPGPSGTMSDGIAVFDEKTRWELKPMIGTIGVAPIRPVLEGSCTIDGQGPWGGNYDCRDICKGNRLYLPVYHEGGLLYLGDVHGSQGDTEFTGVANETRSEVTLSCSVIKNKKIPFPRIEKPDSIIQLNSYRPLEDAMTQAYLWLMQWLVEDYGFHKLEAYLHMSVNPYVRAHVYQMVKVGRIAYTVGAEYPKKYLKNR